MKPLFVIYIGKATRGTFWVDVSLTTICKNITFQIFFFWLAYLNKTSNKTTKLSKKLQWQWKIAQKWWHRTNQIYSSLIFHVVDELLIERMFEQLIRDAQRYRLFFMRSIVQFFTQIYINCFCQFISTTNWVNLWTIDEYHVKLWLIWKKFTMIIINL